MKWSWSVLIFLLVFSCKSKVEENKTKEKIKKPLTAAEIQKIRKEINAGQKEALIKEAFERRKNAGFNGTILIAQRGIVLLEQATGFAHDTLPNTIDSKFQLASLSKTFTALAVMKLVQEGKIGLDHSIEDYYPNFPYKGVTIRSLLSHRSGLPHYEYNFDRKVRENKIYLSNQQMMQWWEEIEPKPSIVNKPDHYFGYNNTNFAILAAIVEKVSGQSFDSYLKQNIFDPAGMKDTFVVTTPDSAIQVNRTYGYQNGRKIPKDFFDDITGDKGVYSTAPDLLKYYEVLKEGTIVSKENLREMYTPRSFEHPGLRNYGYGFRLWVNQLQQTEYIYHTGWWKGYNTIMFFNLREDFVIIILSNKYNRNVYNIRDFVDILHGEGKASSLEDNLLDQ